MAEFTPRPFAEYLTAQATVSLRSCPNEVARQERLRMLDKQGTAAMPTAAALREKPHRTPGCWCKHSVWTERSLCRRLPATPKGRWSCGDGTDGGAGAVGEEEWRCWGGKRRTEMELRVDFDGNKYLSRFIHRHASHFFSL